MQHDQGRLFLRRAVLSRSGILHKLSERLGQGKRGNLGTSRAHLPDGSTAPSAWHHHSAMIDDLRSRVFHQECRDIVDSCRSVLSAHDCAIRVKGCCSIRSNLQTQLSWRSYIASSPPRISRMGSRRQPPLLTTAWRETRFRGQAWLWLRERVNCCQ